MQVAAPAHLDTIKLLPPGHQVHPNAEIVFAGRRQGFLGMQIDEDGMEVETLAHLGTMNLLCPSHHVHLTDQLVL